MDVQIGDARLRNWNESLLFSFPAEVFRDQSLRHVILEAFAEALADDGCGHVSSAKARQPRTLLIALNLQLGFTDNFGCGNLNRNLSLDCVLGFRGAHIVECKDMERAASNE